MVYPTNFIKVTNTGVLAGTDEIFSFGYHFAINGANISSQNWEDIQAAVQPVAQASLDFWNTTANHIPSNWGLTSTKIALINPDGKYDPTTRPYEFIHETPVPGTDPFGSAPQLAAVVSLVSSVPRDPGRYNRFYVPTAAPQTARYALPEATCRSLANTAKVLMVDTAQALQDATGATIRQSVMSASGTGKSNLVVDYRVGDVVDTQRRRRNKIPETYYYNNI